MRLTTAIEVTTIREHSVFRPPIHLLQSYPHMDSLNIRVKPSLGLGGESWFHEPLASAAHFLGKPFKYSMILSAVLCLLSAPRELPLNGQTPPPHPTSTPYAGDLSIFEDPGRDKRLQIGRVMDLLHLKPGSVVADIGAGGGWFSVRAARRVAPNGTVIAEDINPKGDRLHSAARSARTPQQHRRSARHAGRPKAET